MEAPRDYKMSAETVTGRPTAEAFDYQSDHANKSQASPSPSPELLQGGTRIVEAVSFALRVGESTGE